MRKEFIKLLKKHQLKLKIKCNLKNAGYLDITFNLNTSTDKPFNTLNNKLRYIIAHSEHPRPVLKEITKSLRK